MIVVVESQSSGCHEKDEAKEIVDELEKWLVGSNRTPDVRNEQRKRDDEHATHCDNTDVVTVNVCAWIAAEIQLVGANENQTHHRNNLT